MQQRNGRKSLTTVQGLPEAFDYKKILKALKKGEPPADGRGGRAGQPVAAGLQRCPPLPCRAQLNRRQGFDRPAAAGLVLAC